MKLVFSDFDRCVVSHDYPAHIQRPTEEEFLRMQIMNDEKLYKWAHVLPRVRQYLLDAYNADNRVFVISHTANSFEDNYKREYLDQHDMRWATYIGVRSPEMKIDVIKQYAKIYAVPIRDCILIEDRMSTVYLAAEAGITAHSLSDLFIEEG